MLLKPRGPPRGPRQFGRRHAEPAPGRRGAGRVGAVSRPVASANLAPSPRLEVDRRPNEIESQKVSFCDATIICRMPRCRKHFSLKKCQDIVNTCCNDNYDCL